ncbi:MAG: Asp-tRNA(Asn)/Glu-tRNA(Gln) amidotransferase subunit GatC [Candidatus Binatia bacterium]
MHITLPEVQRIAALARLILTPAEEQDLLEHFDKILSHVEKLNTVDTTDVTPMSHAVEVLSPLREDRVTNQPDPEALLANAPAREDHFFKVPKIIE